MPQEVLEDQGIGVVYLWIPAQGGTKVLDAPSGKGGGRARSDLFHVCTSVFKLLGTCQGCRWLVPMVGAVWAWTELLACVLFASCSYLKRRFHLLEITMRILPAGLGRIHRHLQAYTEVPQRGIHPSVCNAGQAEPEGEAVG